MLPMADPEQQRPRFWLTVTLVVLAAAVLWTYWPDAKEAPPPAPKERPSFRAATRSYAPPNDPAPGPVSFPAEIAVPGESPPPRESAPMAVTPAAESQDAIAAPVLVPEPEPAAKLPPCPRPKAELRAAWSRRDWQAVHDVLAAVLDRQDCDPDDWYKFTGVYYETKRLLQDRQARNLSMPEQVFRRPYLAILKTLDDPSAIRDVTIEVLDAGEPDGAGFRRVNGADGAGRTLAVLTQQDAAPGDRISFWGIEEPESNEPGLLRDVSAHASVADVSLLERLLKDPEARKRLRPEMRTQFEAAAGQSQYALAGKIKKRVEALRQMAESKLAEVGARDTQADEAALAERKLSISKREEALVKGIGDILRHLR